MTTMNNPIKNIYLFRLKDYYSALTHIIGFILSILAMPILLCKAAANHANLSSLIAYSIYALSMILLYGASSAYHSFNISPKANAILKRIDHMSIFILIAGTYTPICVVALRDAQGLWLLFVTWLLALAGIIFKYFFVFCKKWVSSILYLAMGWLCIFILPALYKQLGIFGFLLLAIGGLFYSIGALIYAKKNEKEIFPGFGAHEVFHCFVLAGSLCHFLVVLFY
ncbi:MAG: hemolysin III family protein [Solobacterium sp.]|nr:hemolysin III family protein [Solobacterium sp.]